jgi:glucose-1-phosphate thymidylyltransferase
MTGILLVGGNGTRLFPTTAVANKQLLPLYNKPLFYYSLSTLINLGAQHICIVGRREDLGFYKKLLISPFGAANFTISFVSQEEPLGIAHAIGLCEKFVKGDFYYVILGDNVFVGDLSRLACHCKKPWILTSKVATPNQYGVLDSNLWRVVEKPREDIGDAAVTGLYHLPLDSFGVIRNLEKSDRGEYEIADVINHYMKDDNMRVNDTSSFGVHWFDCGNFDDILDCAALIKSVENRTGTLFGDFVAELSLAGRQEMSLVHIKGYLSKLKDQNYINKFKKRVNLI